MMSLGKPDVRESEAGTCAGRARAAVQDAARRRPLSWAYARQEPSLANGLEPCLIALQAPLSEANHFSLTSLCKVAAPTGPSRGGYSTGFSNGAGFTYLLWAERPAVFAAFAPVAGRLRPSVQPREAKPVFHVVGTADETVPFASQQEAIDLARRVDGATGAGTACGKGCTAYRSPGGAPVMTWIHAGGHEYPSDTSALIAKFFRDH